MTLETLAFCNMLYPLDSKDKTAFVSG